MRLAPILFLSVCLATTAANAQSVTDLATHLRQGEALVEKGDAAAALDLYRDLEAKLRDRLAQTPSDRDGQRLLAATYWHIGGALALLHRPLEALTAFHQERGLTAGVLAKDPLNPVLLRDLAVSDARIGLLLQANGHLEPALAAFDAGATTIEDAIRRNGGKPPLRYNFDATLKPAMNIAEQLRRYAEAADFADRRVKGLQIMGEPPAAIAQALGNLSWLALLALDFDRARIAAEQAYAMDRQQSWALTNAAHALMFQDQRDAMLALHQAHRQDRFPDGVTWDKAVLQDFEQLRALGMISPLMVEVEDLFSTP